jgi:hypothetical protein
MISDYSNYFNYFMNIFTDQCTLILGDFVIILSMSDSLGSV